MNQKNTALLIICVPWGALAISIALWWVFALLSFLFAFDPDLGGYRLFIDVVFRWMTIVSLFMIPVCLAIGIVMIIKAPSKK